MYFTKLIYLQLCLVAVFVSCDVTEHNNMVKARKYIYAKAFHGEPKRTDFEIVEEHLPAINDGEFLVQALYISVDPYMRGLAALFPVGSDMVGSQIAKVIESKNKDFPVNAIIFGDFGWRTYTIVKPTTIASKMFPTYILPDFGELSPSLGLGILGMPGITAYLGFMEVCKPKKGDTVVVTSAAGTVGSTVGQIAHIMGCKVIGFAGTAEKCNWVKEIGFDNAFNYKTSNIDTVLNEAAPDGIDCYFDTVGGELSDKIIGHMKQHGRVAKVGSISSYNLEKDKVPKSSINASFIASKELNIEQFSVLNYLSRWQEALSHNLQWTKDGKLKYKEIIIEGFDNLFDAFIGLLKGRYTGKPVVKV